MLPLNTASKLGLSVLLLLAGVIALRLGESVFVPMLIALMLATVLGPAAWWLHNTFKIRWGFSCIIVVIGLIAANMLVMLVFSASVMRLVNQLSDETKAIGIYNEFRTKLVKVSPVTLDEEYFPKEPKSLN